MKRNPDDVLLSYSNFTWQLKESSNIEYEKYVHEMAERRTYRENIQELVDVENTFFLLSYIFNPHPGIDKEIGEAIRKGKFTDEKIKTVDFLNSHPELIFYQYILLKDNDRKYNIGYFTDKIHIMIKTLVDLNIFFLDAYMICKIMDKIFDWSMLGINSRYKTRPLRIGFNNILMVRYEDGRLFLNVNEDGLRKFDSYRSDKIILGLYSGNDLLYCRKISVPVFYQGDYPSGFNQNVRVAIYKDDIGEDKRIKWSDLLPDPEADGTIYKDISEWMNVIGLTSNNLKNKN